MKRFDVTFKGQLLPRREPEQVKAGFAELFQIKDPGMLEEIFSGQAVILRSNLDRKTAAEYFMKMNKLGAVAELVPSAASMREHTNGEKHAAQINGIQPHIVVAFEEHDGRQAGEAHAEQPGQTDKTWPVSAARIQRKPLAVAEPHSEDLEAAILKRVDQEAAKRKAKLLQAEREEAQRQAQARQQEEVV